MQKKIFLTLIALLCYAATQAQPTTNQTKILPLKPPVAAIKLNLYNTIGGALSLAGEVRLTKSISVNLGYTQNQIGSGSVKAILKTYIKDQQVNILDSNVILNPLKTRTIIPEIRFYVGSQTALKGFYVAPYMRFLRGSTTAIISDLNNKQYNTSATLNANRFGVMLGYQWIIKKHFVVDWGIGGLQLSKYKLVFRGGPVSASDYQTVIDNTNTYLLDAGLPTIPTTAGYNVLFDDGGYLRPVSVSTSLPGFRAALSIGYRF